jgi:hypothetical protein
VVNKKFDGSENFRTETSFLPLKPILAIKLLFLNCKPLHYSCTKIRGIFARRCLACREAAAILRPAEGKPQAPLFEKSRVHNRDKGISEFLNLNHVPN